MIVHRRHFLFVAAGSVVTGALSCVAVRSASAQVPEGGEFVPGQILIGTDTTADRDSLARRLEQSQRNYRAGNDSLAGLTVEKSGNSSLRLKVQFSDTVKGRVRGNPNAELGLLQDLADQIRSNNPNIRYAHPNWIVRVDPVEQTVLSLPDRF
jgi:hypothetical protein